MATYIYEALQRDGGRIEGRIEAQSRAEAYDKLDREKLQPISLRTEEPDAGEGPVTLPASGILRLSRAGIITFTEELGDLLEAGLQLEPALRVMEQRREQSSLKPVIIALRQQVLKGRSFSDALRIVSPSFGDLYCNLAVAGEASGALPQILRRQLDHLVIIQDLQDRIRSALIYPSIVFGAAVTMLLLFMTYLVPQLTTLFTKTGKELPFATQALIGVSNFMAHYWAGLLAIAALAVFSFHQSIKRSAGRAWWDREKMNIPLAGAILKVHFYTHFAQTMATLVRNGIPLLRALHLVTTAETNVFRRNLLRQTADLVGEGASLSRSLIRSGLFPSAMIDIITVGEQTGDIGLALEKASLRYDKELKRRIQRLTEMIEPAIIVFMALLVGLVAYSMVTGIFQGVSGLRTHL